MAKKKKKPEKKSLFSRLTGVFQEEEYDFEGNKIDPAQTSDDVDKGIESAITAIKNSDVTLLEGDGLLGEGWGSDGDSINIMDLSPIFAMIGGPAGRQAENLRETCERIFDERVKKGDGKASIQGDKFLMRFLGANEAEGFYLAAIIVNDIGNHILGGRFVALEAPALLVVGDAGDLIGPDGKLDRQRLMSTVESGGHRVELTEPPADAPEWMQLRWNEKDSWGIPAESRIKDKPVADPGYFS
jgi:hypothetical protein